MGVDLSVLALVVLLMLIFLIAPLAWNLDRLTRRVRELEAEVAGLKKEEKA